MGVEISSVAGARDLKRFIDLPFRLHANHPQWVPPLKLERWLFLARRGQELGAVVFASLGENVGGGVHVVCLG
ncbi:MAG TPA: hypothetical protein VGI27_06080, partial [Solirubrobacteraceae bacterium]